MEMDLTHDQIQLAVDTHGAQNGKNQPESTASTLQTNKQNVTLENQLNDDNICTNNTNTNNDKKCSLYCDCLCFIPTLVILMTLSLIIMSAQQLSGYHNFSCNVWNHNSNIHNNNNTLKNCDIYSNSTNDDVWRLCNMFINVSQLHSHPWNWFQQIESTSHSQPSESSNYNFNFLECNTTASGSDSEYNKNGSCVCNWKGIKCNENQTNILEIKLRETKSCSDINMSYIPSNLKVLDLFWGNFRFEWNVLNIPITIETINFDANAVYGNMNDLSRLINLKKLSIGVVRDIKRIDFTHISNKLETFHGELYHKCNPETYCGDEYHDITNRIQGGCAVTGMQIDNINIDNNNNEYYKMDQVCLRTCGYCVPRKSAIKNNTWEPAMHDLTTMFIVLVGCLLCTIGTLLGVLCGWNWNSMENGSGGRDINNNNSIVRTDSLFNVTKNDFIEGTVSHNYHVLVNHIGFGALISCAGILLLLISYITLILYGDDHVSAISTFCGASLSTLGWGAMEYGYFNIEKRFGFLKDVIINKKYKKQIINHSRLGKLYWYNKTKIKEGGAGSNVGNRSRRYSHQSKYLRFIKVGSNCCLNKCRLCCYGHILHLKLNIACCKRYKYIKIHLPSYMEWRFLIGGLMAPPFGYLAVLWWYYRTFNSFGPYQHSLVASMNFLYTSFGIDATNMNVCWVFTILYIVSFAIPSLFSKFALIHGCCYTVLFVLINVFSETLFTLPYQDSAGIAFKGPVSVTPIFIWLCIAWSMLQLFVSVHFSSKKEVQRLSSVVTAKFLSIFDVITDVLVVYTWILGKHYFWASIQLSILICSQIFVTIKLNEFHNLQLQKLDSNYINCENRNQNMKFQFEKNGAVTLNRLTTVDSMMIYENESRILKRWQMIEKIITLIGLGRLWFASKVWIKYDYHDYYRKIKLLEIILESFPSVALMYYVTLSQESKYTESVMLSIIISFVNICVAIAKAANRYLRKLNNKNVNNIRSSINTPRSNTNAQPQTPDQTPQTQTKLAFSNQSDTQTSTEQGGLSVLQVPQSPSIGLSQKTLDGVNDIEFEQLVIVHKNGEVKFKLEKDFRTIAKSNSKWASNNAIQNVCCKKWNGLILTLKSKRKYAMEIAIILFMLTFVLTDAFLRISPPLLLFLKIKHWNSDTNDSDNVLETIIATVVAFVILFVLLFIHYLVYKSNEFLIIVSGIITNWYYFSCAVGMDYFDSVIEWKSFMIEQIIRLSISVVLMLVVIVMNGIESKRNLNGNDNEFDFENIIVAFACMVVVNATQLYFVQKMPRN